MRIVFKQHLVNGWSNSLAKHNLSKIFCWWISPHLILWRCTEVKANNNTHILLQWKHKIINIIIPNNTKNAGIIPYWMVGLHVPSTTEYYKNLWTDSYEIFKPKGQGKEDQIPSTQSHEGGFSYLYPFRYNTSMWQTRCHSNSHAMLRLRVTRAKMV